MQELIFLPGWSGTDVAWQQQKADLKDIVNSHVYLLTEQTTIDAMVDEVLEKAPEIFTLVGHSLGGVVAQAVAIKAPARVRNLILLATWPGDTIEETRMFFSDILTSIDKGNLFESLRELRKFNVSPSLKNNKKIFDEFEKMQESFPMQAYINQTKALLNATDLTKELHKITCPTLIVKGEDDAAFTDEQYCKMVNHIPLAKFTIIPRCGHMQTLERPEAVSALVRLYTGKQNG